MAELELTHARPPMPSGEPFPLMPPGIPADFDRVNYGVCDPSFRSIRQAGEAWRYATAFLRLTATAGASMTYAANTVGVDLWNYGVGDNLSGYGFNNTVLASAPDTDLNTSGAPVKDGEKFYAVGMGVEILRPFTTDNTQSKTYDPWLDAWRSRIYEVLQENLAVQLSYGDDACEYYVGTLAMWPRIAGPQGQNLVRNGGAIGPANMVPFKRPLEMGARDQSDQLTISLVNNWALTLGADAAVPIPVGVTQVVVPIQVVLYGFPVCAPANVSGVQAVGALMDAAKRDPAVRAQLRALLGF